MGIEPTPSHLRCAALPVELPSPLGARWWGVGYTNVSFLGVNYILNTKFSAENFVFKIFSFSVMHNSEAMPMVIIRPY